MHTVLRASSIALCLVVSVNCVTTDSALALVQKRATAIQESKLSTNSACKDAWTYLSNHDFHQGAGQGGLLNGNSLATTEKDAAMKHFIRGIVEDLHGNIVNEQGLEDLVPLFSGSIEALPFRTLMEKLRTIAAQPDSWLDLPDTNAVTHAERWNLEHFGEAANTGTGIEGSGEGSFQFPRNVGRFAALNEEGYASVVAAKDSHEMAQFVVRTLHNNGLALAKGGGPGNADLQGLVPWFSGECAVQSMKALNAELIGAVGGWVVEDQEAKQKKEDEAKAEALYEAHQQQEADEADKAQQAEEKKQLEDETKAKALYQAHQQEEAMEEAMAAKRKSERAAPAHHSHDAHATRSMANKKHDARVKSQKNQKGDSKTHKEVTSERKQVASKMASDTEAEPEAEDAEAVEGTDEADDSVISRVSEKAEEVKEVLSEKAAETQELVSQKVEEAKEVISEKTEEAEQFVAEKAEEVKGFVAGEKEMVAADGLVEGGMAEKKHGKHDKKSDVKKAKADEAKHDTKVDHEKDEKSTKHNKNVDVNHATKEGPQNEKSTKKHEKHDDSADAKQDKNDDNEESEEKAKESPQPDSWFSWMKR